MHVCHGQKCPSIGITGHLNSSQEDLRELPDAGPFEQAVEVQEVAGTLQVTLLGIQIHPSCEDCVVIYDENLSVSSIKVASERFGV